MSLTLYMDHHIPMAITRGLRQRGVDVLTAQEDGTATMDDPALLDRALALSRVLYSQDHDLLREAARRQQAAEPFAGVIYVHQLKLTIGQRIDDLEVIAKVCDPLDLANCVVYLPL
jgi:hypothetical protein